MTSPTFRSFVLRYALQIALAAVALSFLIHLAVMVFGPMLGDVYREPTVSTVESGGSGNTHYAVVTVHTVGTRSYYFLSQCLLQGAALVSLGLLLWVQRSAQPPPLRR